MFLHLNAVCLETRIYRIKHGYTNFLKTKGHIRYCGPVRVADVEK